MAVLCVLVALVGGPQGDTARAALQPHLKQLEAVAQILARRAEMERKYLTKLEGGYSYNGYAHAVHWGY